MKLVAFPLTNHVKHSLFCVLEYQDGVARIQQTEMEVLFMKNKRGFEIKTRFYGFGWFCLLEQSAARQEKGRDSLSDFRRKGFGGMLLLLLV